MGDLKQGIKIIQDALMKMIDNMDRLVNLNERIILLIVGIDERLKKLEEQINEQ